MDIDTQVKKWRQELHQIPELGLQETKTASYLFEELKKMGHHPMIIVETGILVYIDYGKTDSIAFRSDIDGLAMTEKTGALYSSIHEGYMHACGHDGHMAALLGFAKKIQEYKELPYNIVLLFQPAEESPGGARLIVETGVLQKYRVKAIFGMHLMPSLKKGVIASKAGPLMAQNSELDVTIVGKSAHAGLYYQGIDSIMIASQLINEYQTILTRLVSPFAPAVLHVGKINGGTSRNIVGDTTQLQGTIRTYNQETFLTISNALENIHKAKEDTYGCSIIANYPPMYPPVINDKKLYQKFITCLTSPYLELEEPVMLAEDFAYYQQVVPGIFFYLGTKSDKHGSGLHTETFDFEEDVLVTAIDAYIALATNLQLGDI